MNNGNYTLQVEAALCNIFVFSYNGPFPSPGCIECALIKIFALVAATSNVVLSRVIKDPGFSVPSPFVARLCIQQSVR